MCGRPGPGSQAQGFVLLTRLQPRTVQARAGLTRGQEGSDPPPSSGCRQKVNVPLEAQGVLRQAWGPFHQPGRDKAEPPGPHPGWTFFPEPEQENSVVGAGEEGGGAAITSRWSAG